MPPLLALYALSLDNEGLFYIKLHTVADGAKQLCLDPIYNLQDLKPLLSRYTHGLKLGNRQQPRREIMLGLGLSLPILIICGALLASSDVMFNNLIAVNFNWLIDWLDRLISFRGIVIILVSLYSFGFLWQLMMPHIQVAKSHNIKKSWSPVVIITLLLSINLMYLIFTGIQISYLYARFSQLPTGFSYAEYARQGFFQLFFVALINISLSSLFIVKVKTIGSRLDTMFKGLNTLMSLLTCNLLVSSFYKLCLYEQAFGFTHLRLWVQCFIIALGICLLLLTISIWKEQQHLFHKCFMTLIITYCLTGFVVNDWNIANWNLDFYAATNHIDVEYLSYLSIDAGLPINQVENPDAAIKNLQKLFAANHIHEFNLKPKWYEWNYLRYKLNQL